MTTDLKALKVLNLRINGLDLGNCFSRERAYEEVVYWVAYGPERPVARGANKVPRDFQFKWRALEAAKAVYTEIASINEPDWPETLRGFMQEGDRGYFCDGVGQRILVPSSISSKKAAEVWMDMLIGDETYGLEHDWGNFCTKELTDRYGWRYLPYFLLEPFFEVNNLIRQQIAHSSLLDGMSDEDDKLLRSTKRNIRSKQTKRDKIFAVLETALSQQEGR